MSSTTAMTNGNLLNLLDEVSQWILNTGTDPGIEEKLADDLNKILEPNYERPPKIQKITHELTGSIAAEDDNEKTKGLKDVIRLVLENNLNITQHDFIWGLAPELKRIEWDDLKKGIKDLEDLKDCDIVSVTYKQIQYTKDKEFEEKYNKLVIAVSPWNMKYIKDNLKELFNSNQPNDEGNDIIEWDKDFVIARNLNKEEKPDVNFSLDMAKSAAAVITGESGSGKSWFVKKWLPSKHQNASFIYHEINDEEAKGFGFDCYQQKDENLGKKLQEVMKGLCSIGKFDRVYKAVSELSEYNNCERNEAARKRFDEIMENAVKKNEIVKAWWENPDHCTLEELVIILDEMGKAPNLARGIVDEVRQISIRICNKKLAKKVMLVIVGSGLDYYLGEDSLEFEADASETVKFGTDPMKSNVTILDGPNVTKLSDFGEISMEAIMDGTYSQVLATNTRMLTRGIIPVLKSRFNTLNVDNPFSRQIELGSTNVVMDYAARVYIELNGLKRLSSTVRENLLLEQFRILVQRYRREHKAETNPAFNCSSFKTLDYESVLKAGLITADIKGTSKALRYLACKGQTAPLNAQDGIAFEIVLQHHLARLCRAKYDGQNENYYCDRYALVQSWPPPSTKKKGLDEKKDVDIELKSRYDNEKTKIRLKNDAKEIAKLLKGKTEYDLVLRQTNSNVQGADVLVLSKRLKDKNPNLDLYQAKHYNKIPSRSSQETIGAFASLGVYYEPHEKKLTMNPQSGSAGYSYLGTEVFANKLSQELEATVCVRKRVVVFSKSWASFLNCRSWKQFDFDAAKKNNVWIWSREMLEPTISALITGRAFEISSEEDKSAS